jgi:hypothetical protein
VHTQSLASSLICLSFKHVIVAMLSKHPRSEQNRRGSTIEKIHGNLGKNAKSTLKCLTDKNAKTSLRFESEVVFFSVCMVYLFPGRNAITFNPTGTLVSYLSKLSNRWLVLPSHVLNVFYEYAFNNWLWHIISCS